MFGSLVSVFSGNAMYFRPFKSVYPVACKVNFTLPVLGSGDTRRTECYYSISEFCSGPQFRDVLYTPSYFY